MKRNVATRRPARGRPTSRPPAGAAGPTPFEAVNAAFGSLGRACMALDHEFRVVHASRFIDRLAGPGAAAGLIGRTAAEVLGDELFDERGRMRQALIGGQRREGWRGLLSAGDRSRLVSISAGPLLETEAGPCAPGVAYLVVLRPTDEEPEQGDPGLIGRSLAMSRILRLLEMIQHSDATVLIEGESGTGKEVLARIIHEQSPRASGPFVAVAPAALPAELLESELFGHVRGAFTGAVRDRVGRFEAASEGTLFLDELGELPAHLQVKLLRVLQDKTFERVGDSTPRRTEARIVAATNRNLRAEIAAGRFREDLYYRLRVVPIEVPPLRARREDIEPIARLLLARAGHRTGRSLLLSPEALKVLLSYPWPGNVRELENSLEFATIVCRGQTIAPEDLPPELVRAVEVSEAAVAMAPSATAARAPAPTTVAPTTVAPTTVAPTTVAPTTVAPTEPAVERAAVVEALAAHGWRRAPTARALGISRSTLWRRMRELGLVGGDG